MLPKVDLYKTRKYGAVLLLIAITLVIYGTLIDADFVNWDDPDYIYANDVVKEFSFSELDQSIASVFSTPVRSMYSPLTILSYGLEKEIYGLSRPGLWHLDNIVLQMGVCILVFLFSLRMGLRYPHAFVLSVFFAVHPMRVEAVAWLTARKDMLFSLFFFWGMYLYAGGPMSKIQRRLGVWLCFVFALLTKVLAVTFPIALILIDYYRSREIDRRSIMTKVPMIVVAFIYGCVSIWLVSTYFAGDEATQSMEYPRQLFYGSYALVVYAIKFLIPFELVPVHPYESHLHMGYYLSALLWPVLGYVLWHSYRHEKRVLFFGLSFFLTNVFFVLQMIPVGQGYLSDRYAGLPYFGLFLIMTFFLKEMIETSHVKKYIGIGIMGVWVLFLGVRSYQQTRVWQDSETLWKHQMSVMGSSASSLVNLASHYESKGMMGKQILLIEKAHLLEPINVEIANELGIHYSNKSSAEDQQKAIAYFDSVISTDKTYAGVYVNRGVAKAKLKDYNGAITDLQRALELDPNHIDALLNGAVIHNTLGQYGQAIQYLERYLILRPDDQEKRIILQQIQAKL